MTSVEEAFSEAFSINTATSQAIKEEREALRNNATPNDNTPAASRRRSARIEPSRCGRGKASGHGHGRGRASGCKTSRASRRGPGRGRATGRGHKRGRASKQGGVSVRAGKCGMANGCNRASRRRGSGRRS